MSGSYGCCCSGLRGLLRHLCTHKCAVATGVSDYGRTGGIHKQKTQALAGQRVASLSGRVNDVHRVFCRVVFKTARFTVWLHGTRRTNLGKKRGYETHSFRIAEIPAPGRLFFSGRAYVRNIKVRCLAKKPSFFYARWLWGVGFWVHF